MRPCQSAVIGLHPPTFRRNPIVGCTVTVITELAWHCGVRGEVNPSFRILRLAFSCLPPGVLNAVTFSVDVDYDVVTSAVDLESWKPFHTDSSKERRLQVLRGRSGERTEWTGLSRCWSDRCSRSWQACSALPSCEGAPALRAGHNSSQADAALISHVTKPASVFAAPRSKR